MPGHSSNPESKLRMRLVPALRITATWSASREDSPTPRSDQLPGCAYLRHPERQHIVGHVVEGPKGGVNCIRTLDPSVPVDYLLVHLHACDQTFPIPYQLSEKRKGTVFVGVRGANQVHGHIGVYEDH